MKSVLVWLFLLLLYFLPLSSGFIVLGHAGNIKRARRGDPIVRNRGSDCERRKGICTYMKSDLDEKERARKSVKSDLDKRGLYVFGVVLLLNLRFTFMPQEIRSIYTCPSGPNREKSITEFKATNPDYVCNEPVELFIKYLTAPVVPPPSTDLVLARPLLSTKYGTGENLSGK